MESCRLGPGLGLGCYGEPFVLTGASGAFIIRIGF